MPLQKDRKKKLLEARIFFFHFNTRNSMFIEKYTFYLYSKAPTLVFRINVVVGINVFWENFVENQNVIRVVYQMANKHVMDSLGHV